MSGRSYSIVAGRRIVAFVALAFAVAYTFYAWRELGFGRWHRPGAAIFPIAVGVIMAIAAIAVFLERKETSDEVHGARFALPEGTDLRRLAAVLGAFAVYFVAMEFIGHLIASALFLTDGVTLYGRYCPTNRSFVLQSPRRLSPFRSNWSLCVSFRCRCPTGWRGCSRGSTKR